MSERAAAAAAMAGRSADGGTTVVAAATSAAACLVCRRAAELAAGIETGRGGDPAPSGWLQAVTETDPGIVVALDDLVDADLAEIRMPAAAVDDQVHGQAGR